MHAMVDDNTLHLALLCAVHRGLHACTRLAGQQRLRLKKTPLITVWVQQIT